MSDKADIFKTPFQNNNNNNCVILISRDVNKQSCKVKVESRRFARHTQRKKATFVPGCSDPLTLNHTVCISTVKYRKPSAGQRLSFNDSELCNGFDRFKTKLTFAELCNTIFHHNSLLMTNH